MDRLINKEELLKWANDTVSIYKNQKMNLGFYTQTPLSIFLRLPQSPDILILGINPGSKGGKDNMTGNELLKGNPCFWGKSDDVILYELRDLPDKKKHKKGWDLWHKIHDMLNDSGKGELLDKLDRFVLSNIIFYGTENESQLPKGNYKKECAEQTLKLIDILKPKVVLLLGKQSKELFNTLIDGPKLETIVPQSVSYCYKDCHIFAIKHTACRYTSYEKKIIGNTIGYALDNPSVRLEKETLESFLTKKANGRSWYLKTMINGNCSIQKIYNEETVYHDFYTTTRNGKYVSSKDNIVIDLTPTEKEYKVLVFTRQNDKEKTRELVKGIWPNEEFRPWDYDNSRHVHRTIPLKESNENIAKIMEQVLSEVVNYRNKTFSLKR